jgi:hypothetical protein
MGAGRRLAFAAAVLATVGGSIATASASAQPPVRYTIEAQPWSCASFVGPLAQEVQLACDASGAPCTIAPPQEQADVVLRLVCQDAGWSLEAIQNGQRIWAVALGGEPHERLRQAGLWAARAVEDPGSLPPGRPMPTVVPAAPPSPTWSPPPPIARHDVRDDHSASGLTFALGAVSLSQGDPFSLEHVFMMGARATAAFDVGPVRLGGAVSYSSTRPNLYPTLIGIAELGGIVSIGAPWTSHVVGVALEGGVRIIGFDFDKDARPYVRPSLVFQAPLDGDVRPFLALSLGFSPSPVSSDWGSRSAAVGRGAMPSPGGLLTTATIDLGLAWSAW